MTKSKLPIKKICEYCGKEFEAGRITSRCCSGYCNKRAYKDAKRKKTVVTVENLTAQKKIEKVGNGFSNRQCFSIAEAAELLGKCRQTIYNLVYSGMIEAKRISSRLTVIPQKSIDAFLEIKVPYEPFPKKKEHTIISDWYTFEEITEKYGIQYGRLNNIINKNRIPKKKAGRTTLIAKNRIDDYFKRHGYDEAVIHLSEWVSISDLKEIYGMTETSAYSFLSENNIPKKQKDGKRYYSKWHIDKIKHKEQ